MTKKLLAITLCFALVFTFAGCGVKDLVEKPSEKDQTPPVTDEAELKTYPLNADVSLAEPLPDNIWTTAAEENGLEGNLYTFTGTVIQSEVVGGSDCIYVSVGDNTLIIANAMLTTYNDVVEKSGEGTARVVFGEKINETYIFPEVGEEATFVCTYHDLAYTSTPLFLLGTQLESKTEENEPETNTDNITTSQKNALDEALSYLRYMSFSRQGLIDQLEYEQYSTEDATWAVDNCGADWYEQALDMALSYLEYNAFSYQGLIDQLEYEGFTAEEARYGADNCGADWYEEAVECAESYLEFMSFSRAELIDQLEYEGFTYEEAVYGAEANGL